MAMPLALRAAEVGRGNESGKEVLRVKEWGVGCLGMVRCKKLWPRSRYSALASGVGYSTPTNQGIRAHTVDCYKVYPFGGYTS